jgi:hypothetical protein
VNKASFIWTHLHFKGVEHFCRNAGAWRSAARGQGGCKECGIGCAWRSLQVPGRGVEAGVGGGSCAAAPGVADRGRIVRGSGSASSVDRVSCKVRRMSGISVSSNLFNSVSCSFVIGASAFTSASRNRTSRSGGGMGGPRAPHHVPAWHPRAGAAPRAGAVGVNRLPASPKAPKSTFLRNMPAWRTNMKASKPAVVS